MKLLLFLFVVANAITWQGKTTFWNEASNWIPERIPNISDHVFIENIGIPPYINYNVEVKSIVNNFTINIYNGSLTTGGLLNNGNINVYISNLTVRGKIIVAGNIHIVESRVKTPFLLINKDNVLSGTGIIEACVFNLGVIMPHNRLILGELKNFAEILYEHQLSIIEARNIVLFGNVTIYAPQYIIMEASKDFEFDAVSNLNLTLVGKKLYVDN